MWGTWIEILVYEFSQSLLRSSLVWGTWIEIDTILFICLPTWSSLVWGTWIEILIWRLIRRIWICRPSCEGRGLKFNTWTDRQYWRRSSLVWGTWIEIRDCKGRLYTCWSSLVWGTWIEMGYSLSIYYFDGSRPSCEGRGLKSMNVLCALEWKCRPSCEGRGLKFYQSYLF